MFNMTEAMSFINSFDKLGKPVSDLNRIAALLDILGNPQDKLRFIHVAGTNGKGSVSEMCSQILITSGYRVGLFTSPYILVYSDRIRINGENIPDTELCDIAEYVNEKIDKLEYKSHFSQFEITTVIAFLYFLKQHCDIVVLETGIGGRLDSTNVIKTTILSIITSISYDHTKILGDSLEKIAYQKAGIIKRKVPCVVSANNSTEVVEVIKSYAYQMQSSVIIPEYDYVTIVRSDEMGSEFEYKGIFYRLKLCGVHQIINAVSVIEAMKIVNMSGFKVDISGIQAGLLKAKMLARVEIISSDPLIILDGSHNPAGLRAMADVIRKKNPSQVIAIIGMMKGKDVKASVAEISPVITDFICVDGYNPNELEAEELVKIIKSNGKNAFAINDVNLAILTAKDIVTRNGLLLICGSLYLASEARKYLIE